MPNEQIVQDNWPEGWIPSSSTQANFGTPSRGLLRMDNLTLDEKGSLKLVNRPQVENTVALGYSVNSIYGAYVNSRKLRYLYSSGGAIHRNYGGAASLTVYDLAIGAGGVSLKAMFLNALGHVIIIAGALQYKDRGDIQWPLQIPQPFAPTAANNANQIISLNNLDGGGDYTNWTAPSSSFFSNAGTEIDITGDTATGVASWQTVYAAPIDTTNFGLTGEDNPGDGFNFNLQVDDPSQLTYLRIDFYLTDPTAGPVNDFFYAEMDFTTQGTIYSTLNFFTAGVTAGISFIRSSFFRQGTTPSLGWNTVKGVRISMGAITPTALTVFKNFEVNTSVVTGTQTYVAVEVNDTGQFVQYSVASAQVDLTAGINYITVDRSAHAVNAQSNGIRYFRNNQTLGEFIEVFRENGAYGFVPAPFIDKLSDQDALAAAAINTSKFLQFFRTQLPTTIIGAIYFASRVIYLTTNSFFPSYQLDFGTYDSRFIYELVGTNSELCLFITKLSVGTFIIATTVDFYQVTGTFSLTSITNADGTVTTTQDVNVLPLGISDPAINSSFFEVEGQIFYMSARGLRSMSNGTSQLLNTSTDLLFRNENRYGVPPVALLPNDLSLIGMVASGTRVYLALPFSNGANAIMVSTYNPPDPAELRGSNYWRFMSMTALCMAREQDGTVIYGDQSNGVFSLENSFTGSLAIDFLTQFEYGQHPAQTKTLGSILIYVDTGGNDLDLIIRGIKENGEILTYNGILNSNGLKVVWVDPSQTLINCLAYQVEITGVTDTFELNYIIMVIVQEYPPLTFYELMPFSNLGKDTLKKLSKWGFVVDTLNNTVTVRITADNAVVSSSIEESPEPQGISTQFWYNIEDLAALDWQIEVIAPSGMHFFKFMNPDVLQVYPPGRLFDQFGPLDLDRQGIVFAMRLRVINAGITLHYELLDNDDTIYAQDIVTTANKDTTYEETFPKGVNTSVFRILLSAPTVFYRFSLEVKVRTTGKETEERWVKL